MMNHLPPWLIALQKHLSPAFSHTGSGPLGTWREISVGGAYIPTLMLLFIGCVGVTWILDQILARAGAYRYIWHPPLFRVSLFACLLSSTGLLLYG